MLWGGKGDVAGASALAEKAISALMKTGESVPYGYRLWAELLDARGQKDVASIWRGRAEAADAPDWNAIPALAADAEGHGEVDRAVGLLEEFVFIDSSRRAARIPEETYRNLARLHALRGDAAASSRTLQKLETRRAQA